MRVSLVVSEDLCLLADVILSVLVFACGGVNLGALKLV